MTLSDLRLLASSPARRPLVIQCGEGKLPGSHRVDELYTGPFWSTYRKNKPDILPFPVYVLSALHGLLPVDAVIRDYNRVLVAHPRRENEVGVEDLLSLLRRQRVALGLDGVTVDTVMSALYAGALTRAGFTVHRLGVVEGVRGGNGWMMAALRERLIAG